MQKDRQELLEFPGIKGKKIQGAFDGGNVTSDSGVLFLKGLDKKMGLIERISACLSDNRHQSYVLHSRESQIRQRVFQIACGYEDADDSDHLRKDAAFKLACGKLPEGDKDLSSQPTITRLENDVRQTELYRIGQAFVDQFIQSYSSPPESIILDIDDTDDPTHGAQQESLFNAYHDEYCYMPLHIYEGRSGKLITTILRPGRRPTGVEIISIIKRIIFRIRSAWPEIEIIVRGDSHFGVDAVLFWCEENGVKYVLGQTGYKPLQAEVSELLTSAQTLYAEGTEREKSKPEHDRQKVKVKLYRDFEFQGKTWSSARRIISKVEMSELGKNIRFIVTNLTGNRGSFIYEDIYCDRGRMELMIKDHKNHLHSDRTSCHSFQANQFRLFLHSAAYVLLHALREKGLKGLEWATAQFDNIRVRLLKVGAVVRELGTRIKIHFPSSFPLKEVFFTLQANLARGFP